MTGAAGFIGSHLCETLLSLGQTVVGLDNLATGHRENVDDVCRAVGEEGAARFTFVEGDLREPDDCATVCAGADYLLHQGALGSVPRSIADPARCTAANVAGFVNILVAARDAGVARVVFASSSSVYGDSRELPNREEHTGQPLTPYAVTKRADEMFASVFGRTYGMEIVGLRYFNVFGPRQDPEGAYAAVIPRWILALHKGEQCTIFGDGSTSRDFSYVANVVQGNILAATCDDPRAVGEVFNIAAGGSTSLGDLYEMIRSGLQQLAGEERDFAAPAAPRHADFREGDLRHSRADVSKARDLLGYESTHDVATGMQETLAWYRSRLPR